MSSYCLKCGENIYSTGVKGFAACGDKKSKFIK